MKEEFVYNSFVFDDEKLYPAVDYTNGEISITYYGSDDFIPFP